MRLWRTPLKRHESLVNMYWIFLRTFFTLFAIFLGKCDFDGVLSRPNEEPEIIKEYSTSRKL